MKLKDIAELMACKEGYELFNKIEEILKGYGISVYESPAKLKDLYTLCYDVAEVLNKGK